MKSRGVQLVCVLVLGGLFTRGATQRAPRCYEAGRSPDQERRGALRRDAADWARVAGWSRDHTGASPDDPRRDQAVTPDDLLGHERAAAGRRLAAREQSASRREVAEGGGPDICFEPPEIRFRAEFDKRGRDRVVPIPEGLAEELRVFKLKFATVGDAWLFPCAEKDDHWPREIFGELYARVERHAGLLHLKGGRFHPFRRKWATERKNLSLVDVMAAGGWRDAQTLHNCYQLATPDGMLEVMSTPVKLRDRKVSGK